MKYQPEKFVHTTYCFKKLITKILMKSRVVVNNRYGLDIIIYKYPTSFNIKIFATILFDSPSLGTCRFFKKSHTHIFFVDWMNSLSLYSESFHARNDIRLFRKYIF
jgi:hypothetical protein